MRRTGAEQLVVAMKSVKADGAKGLHRLAGNAGQPKAGGAGDESKAKAICNNEANGVGGLQGR